MMDELLKDVLGDLKAGRIDEAEALARVKRVVDALRPAPYNRPSLGGIQIPMTNPGDGVYGPGSKMIGGGEAVFLPHGGPPRPAGGVNFERSGYIVAEQTCT